MDLLKMQAYKPQTIANQYQKNTLIKDILIGLLHFFLRFFQGDLSERIGRFLLVRKTYSFIRRSQQYFQRPHNEDYFQTGYQSVIHNIRVNDFIQEVDQNSVAFGLSISDSMVKEIFNYATQSLCSEPGYDKKFLICDLDEYGCLSDGHSVIRALVSTPNNCPAIYAISQDSFLLKIASAYLKYDPTKVTSHLTWSMDCSYINGEIQGLYPVSNFHYDIAGYNFATVYFYITGIQDENSGPHVMIKRSHKKKPLWTLLKAGPYSDETIYSYYNKEDEIQIMGSSGFGFFQDPSCFHKVKVPIGTHRLLLQIRYA